MPGKIVKNVALLTALCVGCEVLKKSVDNSFAEEIVKVPLCSCCAVVGIRGVSEATAALMAKSARVGAVKGIEHLQTVATDQLLP